MRRAWMHTLRSQAATWTPASLGPKLALWHDASMGVTLTEGAVSQWADLSGNGFHATQSNAVARPTANPTGINGAASISFDGVNDFLATTSPWLGKAERSVFIIFKPRTFDERNGIYFIEGSGTGSYFAFQYNAARLWGVRTANREVSGGAGQKTTDPLLLEGTFIPANFTRGAMNDGSYVTNNHPNSLDSVSTAYIGCAASYFANRFNPVEIGAIIGTFGATTPEETAEIRAYLNARFSLW